MAAPNEVTREEFDALKAQVEEIIHRRNAHDENARLMAEVMESEREWGWRSPRFRSVSNARPASPDHIEDHAESFAQTQ